MALALVAVLLAATASGCSDDRITSPGPARRVLIVTVPGMTWSDVSPQRTPHLQSLVDHAAIGDVSTRIGTYRQSATAAYLTLGAGTRSVVPASDRGVALNPGEVHGGVPATELVRRRTGRPAEGIAYVPVGATIKADAPLADVLTDKATVTITSPRGGKILELGGKVGEVIHVGSNLVVLELAAGDAPPPPRCNRA